MNYSEKQKKEHIYSLEEALYQLSRADTRLPKVIPDGIFDQRTEDCVREMQRRHGIKESGRVDYETWNVIFDDYARLMEAFSEPLSVSPYRSGRMHLEQGEQGSGIGMVQLMIGSIGERYQNIRPVPITQILDEATMEQIHVIQDLSGLPRTDHMNNRTWNALTVLYNSVCVR